MNIFRGKASFGLFLLLVAFLCLSQDVLSITGKERSEIASTESLQDDESPIGLYGTVTASGDLISIDVRDIPVTSLLRTIAQKTGISFTVGDDIKGAISLKLSDAILEDALKQICQNRALVYEYLPETRSYRMLSAVIYESGKESRKTVSAGQVKAVESSSSPVSSMISIAGEQTQAYRTPFEDQQVDNMGRLLYKPRELLVKFKKGVTKEQMDSLHRELGSTVIKTIERINLHRIRLRDGLSEQEAIALYSASEIVAIAERHALRYHNETFPNDPDFNKQWGLHNAGQTVNGVMGENDADIDAPEAWALSTEGKEILIAVIDSGVDYNHPDLQGRIWVNPGEVAANGIDDDENGFIDDVRGWDFAGSSNAQRVPDNDPLDQYGHGTHVAGIIAAQWNNGVGVAGVFPKARIMVLKVQADSPEMDSFDIIGAVGYARAKGARIVNLSLGGIRASRSEYEAFQELRDAGILAVCAAGNDHSNMDNSGEKHIPPTTAIPHTLILPSITSFRWRPVTRRTSWHTFQITAGRQWM